MSIINGWKYFYFVTLAHLTELLITLQCWIQSKGVVTPNSIQQGGCTLIWTFTFVLYGGALMLVRVLTPFCKQCFDAHTHKYTFHLRLSCLIHTVSSQTAGKVIRTSLLEISTTYTTHWLCGVHTILCDQHHPAHHLVRLLPLWRRFRSICTRTTTMSHSHFPQAVRLLNDFSAPAPTHHTPSYNNCEVVGWNIQHLHVSASLLCPCPHPAWPLSCSSFCTLFFFLHGIWDCTFSFF